MYLIIADNQSFNVDSPFFVKKKFSSGAWIPSSFVDAQAVVINGSLFSIFNKPPIDGCPVAFIKKID